MDWSKKFDAEVFLKVAFEGNSSFSGPSILPADRNVVAVKDSRFEDAVIIPFENVICVKARFRGQSTKD